ncbi:PIN domain-containing protein [Enterobacter cloacae]|uniref:type II toxin-antitoxin system VapC family toxin n=1 Tax=Enterobacter cloacae TaxID=550 RepID=UPI001C6A492D|nr:PIN domain-containing protein [Enterobacter cloacae]MDK2711086.1 PIN domain-containing protein [Enterobacter cloacae]
MMTRKFLLDTNLLIAAFDENGTTSAEAKSAAIALLSELLSDQQVKLFITPLVRYEVLRGITWEKQDDFLTMQQTLNSFPELEITRDISELSANLFRFDKQKALDLGEKRNVDKRRFDVFHYCSATCNCLELCSADTDIGKINTLYSEYQKAVTQ